MCCQPIIRNNRSQQHSVQCQARYTANVIWEYQANRRWQDWEDWLCTSQWKSSHLFWGFCRYVERLSLICTAYISKAVCLITNNTLTACTHTHCAIHFFIGLFCKLQNLLLTALCYGFKIIITYNIRSANYCKYLALIKILIHLR